jgi:hypothetical protein
MTEEVEPFWVEGFETTLTEDAEDGEYPPHNFCSYKPNLGLPCLKPAEFLAVTSTGKGLVLCDDCAIRVADRDQDPDDMNQWMVVVPLYPLWRFRRCCWCGSKGSRQGTEQGHFACATCSSNPSFDFDSPPCSKRRAPRKE